MKLRQFLVAALALLSFGTMVAQQMPAMPVPVDKDVRIGHLDNGLTYYIRHNGYPEHVASFYIAQKVGSINENDDQRGLAHLLEHLAFNGSDHFKGNSLQEYLQSIGVEYGRNLNAYTSVDKTVYYFTDVPTTRISAVDSCMLILKDWSNGITLTKQAIDDERDVVHNEYRMRMVGQMRMLERSLPKLYPGSKYGYRMPIGLMSVVDGCKPETLRAYYRKWYRPDNQAIIVVGDVDVDHIEAQIKKLFSGIKVPAGAAKVIPEQVPDNDTAIYVVDKDKEQQYDVMQVFMKHDPTPDSLKNDVVYMLDGYAKRALCSMLDSRFSEMAQEPDCPFIQAYSDDDDYIVSRTKDAFSLVVVAKPGKMLEAYAAVLREAKRVRDFGFTATEYQRAKDDIMSGIEKVYTNRNKMKNEQFTSQYVDNFIENEPIPSVETEYQVYQSFVPMIGVDDINECAKELICQTDTNFVTLMMMRDAADNVYPTEQQLADVVKQVRGEQLTAYVDQVKQEPLIATLPKAGKIKSVTENKRLGFKTYKLSNGAKVIVKKTDFKDDEIRFSALANGGSASISSADYREAKMLTSLLGASGLGDFSNNELEKALAGKQVSLDFVLSKYRHGLSGHSTPKDLETLMQLIYLNLTNVSKDEKAVNSFKTAQASVLANQGNNPQVVFQDSLASTTSLGNPLFRTLKSAEVEQVSYDRALALAKQLYGNAKDYTFYFVGNVDEAQLRPFMEQYLASLSSNGYKPQNVAPATAWGEVKNQFSKQMENPQDIAFEMWKMKTANTLRTAVVGDVAGRMLEMDYTRNIREKLSAAYSVGAGVTQDIDLAGKLTVGLSAIAMLNPDKSAEAIPYFFSGLKNAIENPNLGDLQKVKEILLKQAEVDAKTNGYWMGVLREYDIYGLDSYTDYQKTVASIDAKAVSEYLKSLLASGNHIEVIMNADKTAEAAK